jgi:hypothetical protein
MGFALDALRAPAYYTLLHIGQSADERLGEVVCLPELLADAEVGELDLAEAIEQYVLRLEIAVYLVLGVVEEIEPP